MLHNLLSLGESVLISYAFLRRIKNVAANRLELADRDLQGKWALLWENVDRNWSEEVGDEVRLEIDDGADRDEEDDEEEEEEYEEDHGPPASSQASSRGRRSIKTEKAMGKQKEPDAPRRRRDLTGKKAFIEALHEHCERKVSRYLYASLSILKVHL